MLDTLKRNRPQRVIVKFQDNIDLPYEDGIEREIEARGLGSWSRLERRFPGIRIRRLYTLLKREEILALVRRGQERNAKYRAPKFFTYFVVDCPPEVRPVALAEALKAWPSVQTAYPEPASSAPAVDPSAYGLSGAQGYLSAAPLGIGARFAFGIPGGDGANQTVIDLETGWTLDHDDIIEHSPQILAGVIENARRPHGTNVLGVICAKNKGATAAAPSAGIVGIAPNVKAVNVVSYYQITQVSPNLPNKLQADPIADAIAYAAYQFESSNDPGNVLVLEVQIDDDLPCEACEAYFETICAATAAGVVVVEAAGNGQQDLDCYVGTDIAGTHKGERIFDRNTPWEFQESGAIMVASSLSPVPHERQPQSNFGTRIDCYAWGENVETSDSNVSGTDKSSHTPYFDGTSAATAIVAGAALSVQGMREALRGTRFTNPSDLRAILSDPTMNTLSKSLAEKIGVMPNLQAIYNKLIAGS